MKAYILSIMQDERDSIDARVIGAVLSALSAVYLFFLNGLYFLYKRNILPSHKVDAKVVSVGNITLGGTGKTPFVIALAEKARDMRMKPAVLTRGYGNDESHLLKEKLGDMPVLVGRSRVKNAGRAKKELGSDCIILDDGFQHYRIKRDLDIVLIDATRPFGNMRLFPRGVLREPLERLKDADIAILTKSDMGSGNVAHIRNTLKRLNERIEIAESFYRPLGLKRLFSEKLMPLDRVVNKKVALLAGIANPAYFEWMVRNLRADIIERFYYTDHHPYSYGDIASIVKKCLKRDIDSIITTEKDAVRLKRLKNIPQEIEIFALKIDFRISSNEKQVIGRLHSIFSR
jgi:tetraacyldisaccharide 4'-kinase